MTEILATVTFPTVDGFNENFVTNSFAIDVAAGFSWSTDLLELSAPIANFYNTPRGGAGAGVAGYMGDALSRATSAVVLKYYDVSAHLDGSPHGSPVEEDRFTLAGAMTTGSLPAEVALAMTLRAALWADQQVEVPDRPGDADALPDRPRARYTGKLYIGPIAPGGQAAYVAGAPSRPSGNLTVAMLEAGEFLADELAVNGHTWSVWSRKDELFRPISEVQVDNAWDTQRRRGVGPTVRETNLFT